MDLDISNGVKLNVGNQSGEVWKVEITHKLDASVDATVLKLCRALVAAGVAHNVTAWSDPNHLVTIVKEADEAIVP